MAKMFTITGKKATQGAYMGHAAYESAKALATAHKGKIASESGKMLEVNFKSNADAKAFAEAFETAYAEARKAYAEAHAQKAKPSEPTASKGKTKATAPSTKEMTAEEAYHFLYDLALANNTIGDLETLETLAMLLRKAKAAKSTPSSTKKVEYICMEMPDGGYMLKHIKADTTSSTKKSTKKTAPKKPTASKGNAFDYSVIKGETKSDKNKALHAMLVSMGIKDSRTPEYMSVWNARPWAK